jgi:hypothetical protein
MAGRLWRSQNANLWIDSEKRCFFKKHFSTTTLNQFYLCLRGKAGMLSRKMRNEFELPARTQNHKVDKLRRDSQIWVEVHCAILVLSPWAPKELWTSKLDESNKNKE